ncbi:uncharacterized protein LOC130357320 [Hyla sarda]|uniref:uncharacterized protein LOC130357320 n=1 Tax=Hyla sarda TaxID=327740 RepID=UPI0024C2D94E|nr:uncharacterized protein LOC130357320 [Hyla sarda]
MQGALEHLNDITGNALRNSPPDDWLTDVLVKRKEDLLQMDYMHKKTEKRLLKSTSSVTMENFTELSSNTTSQVITTLQILRIVVSILMLLFFGIFVYFMVIILNIFFTTPHVRDTPRYILFIHMLLNDLVYLLIAFFFFICVINGIHFPMPICFIITILSTYLRIFNLQVLWVWKSFMMFNFQIVIANFTDALCFSTVAVIITYTYVKVMLVARRMDSGKFAGKTVLLHAFQLLLSMLSFTTTITEIFLVSYIQYLPLINFFLVMSLPRFASPLIYGLRDELFGKAMRKFYLARILSLHRKSK